MIRLLVLFVWLWTIGSAVAGCPDSENADVQVGISGWRKNPQGNGFDILFKQTVSKEIEGTSPLVVETKTSCYAIEGDGGQFMMGYLLHSERDNYSELVRKDNFHLAIEDMQTQEPIPGCYKSIEKESKISLKERSAILKDAARAIRENLIRVEKKYGASKELLKSREEFEGAFKHILESTSPDLEVPLSEWCRMVGWTTKPLLLSSGKEWGASGHLLKCDEKLSDLSTKKGPSFFVASNRDPEVSPDDKKWNRRSRVPPYEILKYPYAEIEQVRDKRQLAQDPVSNCAEDSLSEIYQQLNFRPKSTRRSVTTGGGLRFDTSSLIVAPIEHPDNCSTGTCDKSVIRSNELLHSAGAAK